MERAADALMESQDAKCAGPGDVLKTFAGVAADDEDVPLHELDAKTLKHLERDCQVVVVDKEVRFRG